MWKNIAKENDVITSCPKCHYLVNSDWNYCPKCKETLPLERVFEKIGEITRVAVGKR